MTFDELDEVLDEDWNEAVETFETAPDGSDDDDAFQDALRTMVKNLQRRAFDRGYQERGIEEESNVRFSVRLGVDGSKELVKAMLNDYPISIDLIPFE